MTNSKHPIVTPADLTGIKMRVPQSDVLLAGFQALGVEVATLPFPLLFEALRAGDSTARKTRSRPSRRPNSTRCRSS